MTAQFDVTCAYWQKKVNSPSQNYSSQIEKIQAFSQQLQNEVQKLLLEPASLAIPKRLHKVRVCGSGELPEHSANFCWPTMEQYAALKLT